MAKGRKTGGGSRKGIPNKPKPFEVAIQAAIEKYGPERAGREIVKASMAALSNEILVESADGQSIAKKTIFNFDGLKTILPYVASKKPETVEVGEKLSELLARVNEKAKEDNPS